MKYIPKSLNHDSIKMGAEGDICGICRGNHATTVPLIKISSDFQHPSVLENYHLPCYFHWALHEWKDWLIDIRHMTPASASRNLKEVQDTLRIQAPWTITEDYFDISLDDSIESLLNRLLDIMITQDTPASWAGRSGFIPWLTNAPRIPAEFLINKTSSPELTKHLEYLMPFWETYLKDQTNLTSHTIQEYLRLAPRCFYSSNWKHNGSAAWDGPYGFWCWAQTLKRILENRMKSFIRKPTNPTLADLIPSEACEPPVGPVFEPRTIETTDGNTQKKIPDNSLANCPLPDISEPDPVPERDPEDFHILQEQEAPDFTPDTFILEDVIKKDLKDFDREVFCEKFNRYSGLLLIEGRIDITEIANPTDPQPDDFAELFMFRYLYRIYESLISEKK